MECMSPTLSAIWMEHISSSYGLGRLPLTLQDSFKMYLPQISNLQPASPLSTQSVVFLAMSTSSSLLLLLPLKHLTLCSISDSSTGLSGPGKQVHCSSTTKNKAYDSDYRWLKEGLNKWSPQGSPFILPEFWKRCLSVALKEIPQLGVLNNFKKVQAEDLSVQNMSPSSFLATGRKCVSPTLVNLNNF